jgi:hypothetical protein
VKKTKILHCLLSFYLFLTGILSLFSIAVNIFQNGIYGLFWILEPILITIMMVTIVNNFKILKSLSAISSSALLTNAIINIIQIINVSFDGFQFKFNQGWQTTVYVNIENSTRKVTCGAYFQDFTYFFNIKFINSQYSVVGLNLIPCLLFLFYYHWYRKTEIRKEKYHH